MARKDLDRWCKGKEGVDHDVEVVLDSVVASMAECHKVKTKWICVHSKKCVVCDRVIVHPWKMAKEECPCYTATKK